MNALTTLTISLVLTATVCASYVRSKVPATQFVEASSGTHQTVEAPPPAPPLPRLDKGE